MFPVEEMDDDVLVEKYEDEITDELADPERMQGSAHRGAAYLQQDNYPPGGASAPQERAFDIVSEKEVDDVDVEEAGVMEEVMGSYAYGCDVLGALGPVARSAGSTRPVDASRITNVLKQAGSSQAASTVTSAAKKMTIAKAGVQQRAGIVKSKTPGGRTVTALKINPNKGMKNRWDPKFAIKNAQDAANRAITVGKKLKAAATKLAKQPKPAKPATAVHGAVAKKPALRLPSLRRPKVKVSPAQLKRLADKAIKAGEALKKNITQFKKSVQANDSRVKAGVSRARLMTKMRGLDDDVALVELFGSHLDQLNEEIMFGASEILVDEYIDEVMGAVPGYTGAVDESDAPTDPNAADPYAADPNASSPYDPNDSTFGLGPPPTSAPPLQEGIDFIRDPGFDSDRTVYSSNPAVPGTPLPVGAIIYDGSQPLPWFGVGSFTRFHGGAPEQSGGANSGYQWGGGDPLIMDGWYLYWASAGGAITSLRYKREGEGDHKILGTGRERSEDSVKKGWGPLVGNPTSTTSASGKPWTAGLRYDAGGNQWFWYYDQAPDWAKRPGELQRLNQAVLEYKAALTAAQAEAAAQALADQAEQKEYEQQLKQQAREDAEYQRQLERERMAAEQQASLQALEQERYDQAMAAQQERDYAADEHESEIALKLLQAQEEAEMSRLDAQEQAEDAVAEAAEVAVEDMAPVDEMDLPPSVQNTVEEVALAEDEVLGSFLRGSNRLRFRRR